MIPKGLKVGATFDDDGCIYRVVKVVGENYESERVWETAPAAPIFTEADVKTEEVDYLSMPYAKLKKLCADKGLDAKGSKADLIARLEK